MRDSSHTPTYMEGGGGGGMEPGGREAGRLGGAKLAGIPDGVCTENNANSII